MTRLKFSEIFNLKRHIPVLAAGLVCVSSFASGLDGWVWLSGAGESVRLPQVEADDPAEGFLFASKTGAFNDADEVRATADVCEVASADYLRASYATHGALPNKSAYGYVTHMMLQAGETYEFSIRFCDATRFSIDGVILLDCNTYSAQNVRFTASESRTHEVFIGTRIVNGAWDDQDDCSSEVLFRQGDETWKHFDAVENPELFYLEPQTEATANTLKGLFPDSYRSIRKVVLSGGVESLPDGFFADCTGLTEVTLPETLVSLGQADLWPGAVLETNGAFVVWGDWIVGCTDVSLTALDIPEPYRHIGAGAFARMKSLASATLPNSLKTVGANAFTGDVRLERIDIPASVETICDSAFEDCTSVREITFAEGVRSIRASAFENCALIQRLVLPASLRDLGARAFADNWRMLSVALPSGVTNIALTAFSGCSGITGATMPARFRTIADLFPDAWSQITDLALAEGETSIIAQAFSGCRAITALSVLPGITNIGARAFENCTGLTEMMLPTSVVSIGENAFSGCTSLGALKLSEGLVEIGAGAFAAASFESIVVPSTVRRLGKSAFPGFCVAVRYLGNAPTGDGDPYASAAAVSYVRQGSVDWDGVDGSTTLPKKWHGHAITFWSPNRLEVDFDACGGAFGVNGQTRGCYSVEEITDTSYALPPLDPVRDGYVFDGWWTERFGGARVTGQTLVTVVSSHSLYAHWTVASPAVTVRFNAGGGIVVPDSNAYASDWPYGVLPVATRDGYEFAGWLTAPEGGSAVTAASLAPAQDSELFAAWTPVTYTLRYQANGGDGTMSDQTLTYGVSARLANCAFSFGDHAFAGWSLSPTGGVDFVANATVLNLRKTAGDSVTLYAVWGDVSSVYAVRFDANGGTGTMSNQTFTVGQADALAKCAFSCAGQRFGGWSLRPAGTAEYADGAVVCDLAESGAFVTLYATWTDLPDEPRPELSDGAYLSGTTAVYDGYVLDSTNGVAFTLQLNVRKTSATAKVTTPGGKVWNYSKGAVSSDGDVAGLVCSTRGAASCGALRLGENGLHGTLGGFPVYGGRNGQSAEGDMKESLALLYKGSWTLSVTNESGVAHLRLLIADKGRVSVTGNLASGAKVSLVAQGILGKFAYYVPVVGTVKSGKTSTELRFLVRISEDGVLTLPLFAGGTLRSGGETHDDVSIAGFDEPATARGGETYVARIVVDDLAYPVKFTASGLPSGLKLDSATGVISGTPTKVGTFSVKVTVTSGVNARAKETRIITIRVGHFRDVQIPIDERYGPFRVGVAVSNEINAVGCAAAGLPSGLKWNKTTGLLSGAPTSVKTNVVTFSKTVNRVAHKASSTFEVSALDTWAIGTFGGGSPSNQVSLSVGKTGKVTGKLIEPDATWSLSANSFASYDADSETYCLGLTAKCGKRIRNMGVRLVKEDLAGQTRGLLVAEGDAWRAYQSLWGNGYWKGVGRELVGYRETVEISDGKVELKFSSNGALTVKATLGGVTASTSSVAVPTQDGRLAVYICLPTGKPRMFPGLSTVLLIDPPAE